MLHLIDICLLTCICLWQISQIQTCLRVLVGPGLVSTSPAFMRSIASHPAGPLGRLAQKKVIGPHCWGREGLPERCDSSTSYRLCRLESRTYFLFLVRPHPFSKVSSLCAIICIIPSIFSAISYIGDSCFKNLSPALESTSPLFRRGFLNVHIGTSFSILVNSSIPFFPTKSNKSTSAPSP